MNKLFLGYFSTFAGLISSLILALLVLPFAAEAARVPLPEAAYPTYRATLTAAVLPVDRNRVERVAIDARAPGSLASRENGRHILEFALLRSPNPQARLMILIPGLGGSAFTNTTLYLAEKIRALGFTVVAVPNPVSAPYALGASKTGLPGYVPRDLAELKDLVLPRVVEALRSRGVSPVDTSLLGYSLGAVYAAGLGAAGNQIAGLPLRRVLLLNPPVDSSSAVDEIDSLYENGMAAIPSGRRPVVLGTLYGFVRVQNIEDSPAFFQTMLQDLRLPEAELSWVVGRQFRYDLRDMILTSQRVFDIGLLREPDQRYTDSPRAQEALQYNFRAYVEHFLKHSLPDGIIIRPVDTILETGGIRHLGAKFRSDPRFVVLHAEDDFLAPSREVEWLEANCPRRAWIFSNGGHLGYLWTPTFQQLLRSLL